MSDAKSYEQVKLRTGIDPNFLADTLTTDIELTDALFDLIDNSIDSARNEITSNDYKKDERGLPIDYSGYVIKVRFSRDSIVVEDNCIGFGSETIENDAFYTGKRSNHKFGIGHYGLGLKRALLKAGQTYGLITDNGQFLYKSKFTQSSFSSDGQSDLLADRYGTTGRKRTKLIVSNLHQNVIEQIRNKEWVENAINELSVRYSIFLRKGLKIVVVNSQQKFSDTLSIIASVPLIRSDNLISQATDSYNTDSVKCDFSVGIHESYKFPGEWNHNQKDNEELTKSYGVYYICNDRVIVAASTEDKHGFTTQWHSEYGGFICLAHVTGENPRDLPWNTAKTEIKINSPLFLEIRKKIEPLAKKYRSDAKILIKKWKSTDKLPDEERRKKFAELTGAKQLSDAEISAISRKKSGNKKGKDNTSPSPIDTKPEKPKLATPTQSSKTAGKNTDLHSKNWSYLIPPNQFPISGKDTVLDNLIIEACGLKIEDAPHASCMLYRALFESAFKHFAKQNNFFQYIKNHYYSKGEGKKKGHSEEYKKQQGIDLSMCSNYLLDNTQLFPNADKNKLSLSAKKIREHIKFMNGVVHGLQFVGNDGKVASIRNETIALLEFLVLAKI